MYSIRKNGGLIQTIILVIIALIILGYFGFDVKNIIESPLVQKNLNYVWSFVKMVWNDYLSEPVLYFWQNIFLDFFWDLFVDNIERLKDGQADDFQNNSPGVGADLIFLAYR